MQKYSISKSQGWSKNSIPVMIQDVDQIWDPKFNFTAKKTPNEGAANFYASKSALKMHKTINKTLLNKFCNFFYRGTIAKRSYDLQRGSKFLMIQDVDQIWDIDLIWNWYFQKGTQNFKSFSELF